MAFENFHFPKTNRIDQGKEGKNPDSEVLENVMAELAREADTVSETAPSKGDPKAL